MAKITTLEELREHMGLTRSQFAKSIGSTYNSYYTWMKNIHSPSVKTTKRIFELAKKHKIEHNLSFQKIVGGK